MARVWCDQIKNMVDNIINNETFYFYFFESFGITISIGVIFHTI